MVREYLTHRSAAGAVLAVTGTAPEHWFAELLQEVHLPHETLPPWLEHLDYRLVAVFTGLSIIVAANLWRRHGRRVPVTTDAAVQSTATAGRGDGPFVSEPAPMPPLRYCTARDGVHLAYMVYGEGPALSHLQLDWENPVRRRFHERLGPGRTLLRYDARGGGLSDRRAETISPQTWLSDLETVVDAAGIGNLPSMGHHRQPQ
jgi:hypothetical protein